MRKHLETEFSILTNTCIGGFVYHKLKKRFLSPTINLWISQSDFVKFCLNLNHYLSSELIFFNKSDRNCPCAKLDDIEIIFNHYSSEEEAAQKWYERSQRIKYDNLFIITSDGNGVTEEELNQLETVGAKRILILTSRKKKINNSFILYSLYRFDSAARHMTNVDIFKTPTIFREVNFSRWLNMKKHFRLPMSCFYFVVNKLYNLLRKKRA